MASKTLRRLLCAIFLLVAIGSTQNATQLAPEIAKLRQSMQSVRSTGEEWKDLKPQIESLLAKAEDNNRNGRAYFALEQIGYARTMLQAFQRADAKPGASFDSAWNSAHAQLVSQDKDARARDWSDRPAAVRALAEAAQGQAIALVDASRPYAKATDNTAGYFYIGQAEADTAYAAFCYGLALHRTGAALHPHSIAPQIENLQQRINAIFKPPLSIEKHPDFIRLNSTVKLANELDQSKRYAGALYEYLLAELQLGLLQASTASGDLRAEATKWKSKLDAKRDDSIAELFLQRAQSSFDTKDATDTKKAAVIFASVLPAYFAAITAPVSSPNTKPQRSTTVTLVRWPFT